MIECCDDVRTASGLCLLDGDGNELGVSSRKIKFKRGFTSVRFVPRLGGNRIYAESAAPPLNGLLQFLELLFDLHHISLQDIGRESVFITVFSSFVFLKECRQSPT